MLKERKNFKDVSVTEKCGLEIPGPDLISAFHYKTRMDVHLFFLHLFVQAFVEQDNKRPFNVFLNGGKLW